MVKVLCSHNYLLLLLSFFLCSCDRQKADATPQVQHYTYLIQTVAPGLTAAAVEEKINEPLEFALATFDEINHIESVAKDEESTITIYFIRA